LQRERGNVKADRVKSLIEELEQANPTKAPANSGKYLEGKWNELTNSNFEGTTQDSDGKTLATLGRVAFNMFEPTSLAIRIEEVVQPVEPLSDERLEALKHTSETLNETRQYDVVVKFTTVEEGDDEPLVGILHNFGECTPITEDRLAVTFTGGELHPADETKQNPEAMARWMDVFSSQQPQGFKSRAVGILMGLMMGMSKQRGLDATGSVRYDIKKSPKGWLDVLYLDDEMRITVGNRGKIVVCDR